MGRVIPLETFRRFVRREVINPPVCLALDVAAFLGMPTAETEKARFVWAAGRAGDYLRGLAPDAMTLRQRAELALLQAADAAEDADAARILRNKADQVALSAPSPFALGPVEPSTKPAQPPRSPRLVPCADDPPAPWEYRVNRSPYRLAPWLCGVVLFAVAMTVIMLLREVIP